MKSITCALVIMYLVSGCSQDVPKALPLDDPKDTRNAQLETELQASQTLVTRLKIHLADYQKENTNLREDLIQREDDIADKICPDYKNQSDFNEYIANRFAEQFPIEHETAMKQAFKDGLEATW